MSQMRLWASRTIDAPPERVWAILSDYHVGHPSILPKAFGPLHVESGGIGAGTIITFSMRLGGATRHFRQEVSAPEPGRVLVESNTDGSGATTFTISPEDEGRRSNVRIETEMRAGGLSGFMTRLFAPRMLQPIYEEELTKLEAVARG